MIKNRYIIHINWTSVWYLGCILLLSGCDLSRSVPLDPPDYKPQLLIHCLASPSSGAQVDIQYNKPLREEDNDLVPPLPQMKVWLLKNGERSQVFTQDGIGIYSISADDLSLEPRKNYALEVEDLTNNNIYTSGASMLPPMPKIISTSAIRDSNYVDNFSLEIILNKVNHPVKAISVFPILLDSLGQPAMRISDGSVQKLMPWSKVRYGLQYNNDEIWSEKKMLFRLPAGYLNDEDHYFPANQVNVYVMYLSDDLTRFARDLEESFFSGEDIFQMVRPVYSNFQKAAGIFGLYNEIQLKIDIKG